MAEKFSVHRLTEAELLPRLQAGEHLNLPDFAAELYDEHMDDFAPYLRDLAIERIVQISRKLMSDAIESAQGAFKFGNLPLALAVPVAGPTAPHVFVGTEHATLAEGELALAALMTQRRRLGERIRAVELFVLTAKARGCPADGVMLDYITAEPSFPDFPDDRPAP